MICDVTPAEQLTCKAEPLMPIRTLAPISAQYISALVDADQVCRSAIRSSSDGAASNSRGLCLPHRLTANQLDSTKVMLRRGK